MPRPQFKPYFDRAQRGRAALACRTPGETTGPETDLGRAAASCGAERIGHGTSAAQDPELLAHLAEHRIALEVCPTSNIATRAVATLDEHPLRELVGRGRPGHRSTPTTRRCSAPTSTTSTRSPPGCSTSTSSGLAALAKNAVEASFLDPAGKARLAAEIDTYASAWLTL